MKADGRRSCVTCGKLIARGANGKRKYCSEQCGRIAWAVARTCPVCSKEFKSPHKNTVCCGPKCANILADMNRSKYWAHHARKKARRLRGERERSANAAHLDSIPNPFAGALNASERAELRAKLEHIRAIKGNHGANMGGEWSQIKRSSSK